MTKNYPAPNPDYKPTKAAVEHACWVCGSPWTLTPDTHFPPHQMCRHCATRQPETQHWHQGTRAAQALAALLDLPSHWARGAHFSLAERAAEETKLRAWVDTPRMVRDAGIRGARFGWVNSARREHVKTVLQRLTDQTFGTVNGREVIR